MRMQSCSTDGAVQLVLQQLRARVAEAWAVAARRVEELVLTILKQCRAMAHT
jgi:hypothetical protein